MNSPSKSESAVLCQSIDRGNRALQLDASNGVTKILVLEVTTTVTTMVFFTITNQRNAIVNNIVENQGERAPRHNAPQLAMPLNCATAELTRNTINI